MLYIVRSVVLSINNYNTIQSSRNILFIDTIE